MTASERLTASRTQRTAAGLVVAGLTAAGLVASVAGPARASASTAGATPALATGCTNRAVLGTWSVAALADQTIVVPVEESDVGAALPAARAGYGGIILFGTTAPRDLPSGLAALRAAVPDHLGLVVMTDEEGGGVQRMADLVGSMPWAAQMAATLTPAQIHALAESVGRRMAADGVDMDLAPVLDVDGRAVEPGPSDPDGYRSFSGTTSVVSTDGTAFMSGMLAGGETPVVKHFPGLGGSSGDTDDGPASTLPWTTLQREALPPFEAAMAAGAPAVMVANATVPGFTSEPASLSASMVTGELRHTLGFRGLIVTDSLSAGAISAPPESLGVPAASVRALAAGDDMVLYGSSSPSAAMTTASATKAAIVSAVAHATLSKAQLVGAVIQVLAAKRIHLCEPTGGYWLASSDGHVAGFGNAAFHGSTSGKIGRSVGAAASLDGRGYWLVAADGTVSSFGDATGHGSEPSRGRSSPTVGMAPTYDGRGYWLATATGHVFALGDARFYGSAADRHLPGRVVAIAATPDGRGYWLATATGAVLPFGDARSYRSGRSPTAPVVAIAATADGRGYWLATADGTVLACGDARSYGSEPRRGRGTPTVGLAATPDGRGYWIVTAAGRVFNEGDAAFYGSDATAPPRSPVVAVAAD